MIVLLLKLIILTSIWVLGLTIVTQEGMALYKIRQWGDKKQAQGAKWVEPLILCHWCMPSIHSIIGFLSAWGLGIITEWSWKFFLLYPFVVMGSSLANGIIWVVYKTLDAANQYFTNGQKMFYLNIQNMKEERNNHQQPQNKSRRSHGN